MLNQERISDILAEHADKYLNFPAGPECNFRLLMLCEDTIEAIRREVQPDE